MGQPPIPFQPPASRIALGNGFLQKLQDCKVPDEGAPAPEPKPSSSKASKEEPATLEEALEAAKKCPKCHPRLSGFKGCSQCMGEWFALFRQRLRT